MSGDRQQLLQSAISFLRDPSAASSPLAQRIAFLESKGLTAPEIEHCLSAAQSAPALHGGVPARGGAYNNGGLTREFERDWRDWFIMGVVGGAVGWLAYKLVNEYISPHLQPPSETELVAAQKALEAKYDEAAAMIGELKTGTDALSEMVESQRKDVERDLEELRAAVKELREGERKREEWTTRVSSQVDDITKSLPNLMDKTANSQAQALQDLQAELKSLKSLVITRRPGSSGSIPASASSPALSSAAGSSAVPATSSPSLPFGNRQGGLPSWQLSGATGAGLASSTTSGASSSAGQAYGTASSAPSSVVNATSEATTSDNAPTASDATDSTVLVEKEKEGGE